MSKSQSRKRKRDRSSGQLELTGYVHGDPHLGVFNFKPLIENSVDLQLSSIRRMCALARKEGVKNIFIPGDIFDNPSPSQQLIIQLINVFSMHEDLDFYIIPGNHDITARGRNGLMVCEFLSEMALLKNVFVFTEPKMVTIDDFPVYFMPYGYDAYPDGAYLGFGHHSVAGAKNDNGFPISDTLGITLSNKRAQWIMGHIHLAQIFKWGAYPGTGYQINFGEDPEKFIMKFKATLEDGHVKLKTKLIKRKPPFELRTVVMQNEDDFAKLPAFDSKSPVFFKVQLAQGVQMPTNFLIENRHVIMHESLTKKGEPVKITRVEDAPVDVFHMTPTTGLVKHLVSRGLPKDRARVAKKLVQRLNK